MKRTSTIPEPSRVWLYSKLSLLALGCRYSKVAKASLVTQVSKRPNLPFLMGEAPFILSSTTNCRILMYSLDVAYIGRQCLQFKQPGPFHPPFLSRTFVLARCVFLRSATLSPALSPGGTYRQLCKSLWLHTSSLHASSLSKCFLVNPIYIGVHVDGFLSLTSPLFLCSLNLGTPTFLYFCDIVHLRCSLVLFCSYHLVIGSDQGFISFLRSRWYLLVQPLIS